MSTSRRAFIKTTHGLIAAGVIAPSPLVQRSQALAELLDSPDFTSGFKVVEKGQPLAVIVTPKNPSHVVLYAVQELQWHVQHSCGVLLPVAEENDVDASALKNRIYIGQGNASKSAGIKVEDLPPNSFRTKTTATAVLLIGKDSEGKPDEPASRSRAAHWANFTIGAPPLDDGVSMGSLFAVYDWLENQVGVKWLWPGELGTVVRPTKVIFAGLAGQKKVVPTLIHSRPRLNVWKGIDPAHQDQYIYDVSVWLRRQRFARGESFEYGHAYVHYWKRFGKEYPTYFALRPDGIRAAHDPNRTDLVQMCVSNNGLPSSQGLHQQIIADWLKTRKTMPSIPWINGAENDKGIDDPSCTCPHCHAWDAPNAPLLPNQEKRKQAIGDTSDKPMLSLSDRYAKFWLALQKEGEKHDPNATVLGYAYADNVEPPVATQLNDRVIVAIVAPDAFPMSDTEEAAFKKLWSGWAATGAQLYWRPNLHLIGYCMPYIFAREFGKIYKYVATRNMIADDYDALLGMWGVQSPNYYMMARLNVDSTLNVDDVLNDYYAGFGPAASQIQKYFSYWETVTLKCDKAFRDKGGGWGTISWGGDEVFTPDTFVMGTKLLQDAKTAAVGNQAILQRLEYLDLWLQHASLCMQALAAFHSLRKTPGYQQLQSTFLQAKAAVDSFRELHPKLIVNIGILKQLELWSGWRKTAELDT
ncbi:hypothetical protein Pla52o_15080 [Novipirellula galeiformis]|uniref:Alpha glucuronidase N-terminal domain-containing protein n=1 Tax=Novipirellula galeiformis TaxID=2528004 RepID=A0A5C6CKT7_9BACT|nr:DUF4838 domain-containing protein [Novipirellula galeiformis]TWU25210.1 hypothetical protein Pla52o_15080 [Novipirellula galeiformis]